MKEGQILSARFENRSEPQGEEAIHEMLRWSRGKFDFSTLDVDMENEIGQSTTHLLLEGARRMARERPAVPLLVLTPNRKTARRIGLLWGAHAVVTRDVSEFDEMIEKAKRMALRHKLGEAGSRLIVCAGVPFGMPGSTNLLHVVRLTGNELKRS